MDVPGHASFASYNRRAVVELIQQHGHLSRRDIGSALGLSRNGLASVLDPLIADGILIEEDVRPATGKRGRPPRLITLSPEQSGPVLALVVRSRRVEVAVVSSRLTTLSSLVEERPLGSDAAETVSVLCRLADRAVAAAEVAPSAAVLTLPTLVHSSGEIDEEGARELMPTWLDRSVLLRLEQHLALPLTVVNETVASAVGETRAGAGDPRAKCTIYVKVGASGTGMCALLDGIPFGGSTGIAGQLGHVSIRGQGVRCPCGQRGCIAAEIDFQVREEVERRAANSSGFTADDLVDLAVSGEPAARRLFFDIGSQLAPALGAAINLFQPSLVVVGGDLATGDTGILAGLEAELSLSVHPGIAQGLEIVASTLASEATAIGAAVLLS